MTTPDGDAAAPHPRDSGWISTTALPLGGSNQSLFLIGALFAGQGAISGQGSAAVPLLIVGLLLSWAAAPGWTELVLLSPHRVGGIAAACTDAFRPYSPILSALTGCCYCRSKQRATVLGHNVRGSCEPSSIGTLRRSW